MVGGYVASFPPNNQFLESFQGNHTPPTPPIFISMWPSCTSSVRNDGWILAPFHAPRSPPLTPTANSKKRPTLFFIIRFLKTLRRRWGGMLDAVESVHSDRDRFICLSIVTKQVFCTGRRLRTEFTPPMTPFTSLKPIWEISRSLAGSHRASIHVSLHAHWSGSRWSVFLSLLSECNGAYCWCRPVQTSQFLRGMKLWTGAVRAAGLGRTENCKAHTMRENSLREFTHSSPRSVLWADSWWLRQQTYLKCANGFSNLENSGLTPPNTRSHTHSLTRTHTK